MFIQNAICNICNCMVRILGWRGCCVWWFQKNRLPKLPEFLNTTYVGKCSLRTNAFGLLS